MYERHPDYEQDLVKAADPSTTSAELEQILMKHHGEPDVASAVAKNPSCNQRRFVRFWRFGEPSAAENPNLETYRQNPHWESNVRREPRKDARKYWCEVDLSRPAINEVLWVMKNGKSAYQRLLMAQKRIPEWLIREHAGSRNSALRKTLAGRETAPDDVFEKLAGDKAKTVRQALAANPHAPAALIGRLASDKDEAVAETARNNPSCPDEAVHRARLADAARPAAEADTGVMSFHKLTRFAADPDTPPTSLAELAGHDEGCVRFLIGFNERTPPEALQKIADDKETWVQAGAAFNPNTPTDALTALMSSDDGEVQVALASNPALSEVQQLELAGSVNDQAALTLAHLTPHRTVWQALADQAKPVKSKSARTWRNFLQEALKDDFVGLLRSYELKFQLLCVARVAARSEKCPKRIIGHYAHYLFDDYRQNPATALALLEGKTHVQPKPYKDWKISSWLSERRAPGHVANFYVTSDDEKRRTQALSSPMTLLVHVLPLVTDSSTVARKRIAERADLNRFAFEMMLRDEKSGVREAAVKNGRCPKSLLKLLDGDKAATVSAAAGKRARKPVAGSIANSGSATDRARLARDTKDSVILTELAGDRAASVRRQVAANHRTPEDVLAGLATDTDVKVRVTSATRLSDKDKLRELFEDDELEVRLRAVRNRVWSEYNREQRELDFDEDMLRDVASSPDAEIRAFVAENTSNGVLHENYIDDVPEVTRALATNRHFSMDHKLALARRTEDQDTLGALAQRTENEELFLIAAGKITSSHVDDPIRCHREMLSRPAVQDQLCTHPLLSVRRALQWQPVLTPRALDALSQDPDERIRKSMDRRRAS